MAEREFGPKEYEALIASFLEAGYRSVGLSELRGKDALLFLRHDVDFDLQFAGAMAQVEESLGVSSTYYLLPRSETYSLCTTGNMKVIQELLNRGHHLGLHFDPKPYGLSTGEWEAAVVEEASLLSRLTGVSIESFSFHRPPAEFLGAQPELDGLLSCYSPDYFSSIGYCSDSRGEWRFGHPMRHPEVLGRRPLQLLTHPIWWFSPEAKSMPGRVIAAHLQRRCARLRDVYLDNSLPFALLAEPLER